MLQTARQSIPDPRTLRIKFCRGPIAPKNRPSRKKPSHNKQTDRDRHQTTARQKTDSIFCPLQDQKKTGTAAPGAPHPCFLASSLEDCGGGATTNRPRYLGGPSSLARKTKTNTITNHGRHNTRGVDVLPTSPFRGVICTQSTAAEKKTERQDEKERNPQPIQKCQAWGEGGEEKGKKPKRTARRAPPTRKQGEQTSQPNRGKQQYRRGNQREAGTLYTTWWTMIQIRLIVAMKKH